MNLSTWIRQFHRWLAIIFTLTVIANFAVMARRSRRRGSPTRRCRRYSCCMFSGLYMFSLPYVATWKAIGGGMTDSQDIDAKIATLRRLARGDAHAKSVSSSSEADPTSLRR